MSLSPYESREADSLLMLRNAVLDISVEDSIVWNPSSVGCIPVKFVLGQLGVVLFGQEINCGWCFDEVESVDHLLLHCPRSFDIWTSLFKRWSILWILPSSLADFTNDWNLGIGINGGKFWRLLGPCIIWAIWISRNKALFNGEFSCWTALVCCIKLEDSNNLSPSQVSSIKSQHSNVKVGLSLGGDSVNGGSCYFIPSLVDSWVSNAVSSLTKIIKEYNLDRIDIDYEHFHANPETFVECIGKLITTLKNNGVISFASIAPFDDDDVQSHYTALWKNDSKASGFKYEKQSQALLAAPLSKQGHWFSFEKRVGKGIGGKIFRETFSGLKGWKKRFFFLDRRAIPDDMSWRHHDSDINDPALEGGFMVTMSEYLRFPFLSGATIEKGIALTNQDQRGQHTVPPLPADQAIPNKTDHLREAKVEDPKIVTIHERKARAAAKKREKKRRGADEGEGSRPKVKRKKTYAVRGDGSAGSEYVSSSEPLRIMNPTETGGENLSGADVATAESRKDRSLSISPHDSADHFLHDSADAHGDEGTNTHRLGPLVDQPGGNLTTVMLRKASHLGTMLTMCPNAQKDSNALNNANALERAWFAVFKKLKNDHAGCTEKIQLLEDRNSELSNINKDQTLRIKELEDTLAKKDFALVYAERINTERAQEKEKLVAQLSKTEMEKFNCIRKLLPILDGLKDLPGERSEEDLLELMSRMEGFDAYADKKMYVEYDKLSEKRYLFVEKISYGFYHTVSDLLKVYPDSTPSGKAPPSKPSSGKTPSSSTPKGP
ncbi:anaphase-promoting complex subunit 10 [Tanacetum coccineum]|uniref:Anaphase-promoting complex subunit 10 n=1 Tax=Tanacetum coccineum TaxID=301880 RepID=A0ABQ5II33_9ASTR